MEQKLKHRRRAFSILDSILALFVVGSMILIYSSLISAREINRRTLSRAQAAALVSEEINALRQLGYNGLTDQTNGPFKNVLYNAGQWQVANNTLVLTGQPNISTTSGRLLFPAGAYDNGTFTADWQIAADSPTGSAIGYFFRASDKDNGYRLRLGLSGANLDGSGHNLVIDKLVNGTATTLRAINSTVTITADTWYTLRLVLGAAAPNIDFYIDDNQQGSAGLTDASFTAGAVALLGWHGVHAVVDDAQTVTTATTTWDFNGTDLPADWIRLGINDLPNATADTYDDNGKITIAPYPGATENLKQVSVRVEWLNNGTAQNYTSTILLGKSELGL